MQYLKWRISKSIANAPAVQLIGKLVLHNGQYMIQNSFGIMVN